MSFARDGVEVFAGCLGRSRVDMKASTFCRMCRSAVTILAIVIARTAAGQEAPLIRELTSREVSMHVGGLQDPEIQTKASREVSLYVENGPDALFLQSVSREVSLVQSNDRSPLLLTNLVAVASPTGDRMQLNWRSYDQWAEKDVARFDVYWSPAPFTNVTSLAPRLSVPAESADALLTGLPAFQDHYVAVVAVDGAGHFQSEVKYLGVYSLTKELSSREVALHVENGPAELHHQWLSREISVVRVTPQAPTTITNLARSSSPSGSSVTLGWAAYNQWAQGDVARYDVYLSDRPFTSLVGMTPHRVVPGETFSVTLGGLPEFRDHFLAVVPVDGLGNFESGIRYAGVYVLTGALASREVGMFVGAEPDPASRQAASREVSVVAPDSKVPEPVSGWDSSFTVAASKKLPRALELEWLGYNEVAQQDVVRYAVYVAPAPFVTVANLTPQFHVHDGSQRFLLTGLDSATIYHVAVVAEDVLGNADLAVRSVSAMTTPRLEMSVPNLTAAEMVPLSYQLNVTEADLREYALNFGLISGPPGLKVASDGSMVWIPAEVQGPGTYPAKVRVTDNGLPAVTATAEFLIDVHEVNLAPSFLGVSDQIVGPTNSLELQLRASDRDYPENHVTFTLIEGPAGMTVSSTGLVFWSPTSELRPSTQRVVVRVQDDGDPVLSQKATFQVVVADPVVELELRLIPSALGEPLRLEVLVATQPGFRYRLEAANVLPPMWEPLMTVAGNGETAVFSDEIRVQPSRYYRVVVE